MKILRKPKRHGIIKFRRSIHMMGWRELRLKSERPEIDFCNICGKKRKLTEDHVPPKFWHNSSQKRYSIAFSTADPPQAKSPFPWKANHGITYKSICQECNSWLGSEADKEMKVMCDAVHKQLHREIFLCYENVEVKVNRVARSVIGHMLAAKNFYDAECTIDNALRAYVLNKTALPPEDMYLYYYPYEYESIVVARDFISGAAGLESAMLSMISSYPLAFLLSNKRIQGMGEMFSKCTTDIDEKKTLLVSRSYSADPRTGIIRPPLWPVDISNNGTPFVIMGQASQSLVIAKGE